MASSQIGVARKGMSQRDRPLPPAKCTRMLAARCGDGRCPFCPFGVIRRALRNAHSAVLASAVAAVPGVCPTGGLISSYCVWLTKLHVPSAVFLRLHTIDTVWPRAHPPYGGLRNGPKGDALDGTATSFLEQEGGACKAKYLAGDTFWLPRWFRRDPAPGFPGCGCEHERLPDDPNIPRVAKSLLEKLDLVGRLLLFCAARPIPSDAPQSLMCSNASQSLISN